MDAFTEQDLYAVDGQGTRRKVGKLKIKFEVEADGANNRGLIIKMVDQEVIFDPDFKHRGLGLEWKRPKNPEVEWEIERHRDGYYRG